MKVASFDIVFQEVPDEVTLALNISGCPNRCPGCHSPHLREDIGEEMTEELLDALLGRYASATCVAFMGGDQAPQDVIRWARFIRTRGRKTAWYSGRTHLPKSIDETEFLMALDYLKLGPYEQDKGGLKSPTTNQRFYRRENDGWKDITYRFQSRPLI